MDTEFSMGKYVDLLENGKIEEAYAYQANSVPDYLYKFVWLDNNGELNEKKLSSLEKGEIWFSSRDAVNDPFEFAGIYIDKSKMRDNGWESDFIEIIKNDILNSLFLASFTSNMSDNIPMWAHYANKSEGFCVKYEVNEKAEIRKVQYLGKRYPIAHVIEKLAVCVSVMNDVTMPEKKRKEAKKEFDERMAFIHMTYTLKHSSWSYENEYRAFCKAIPGEKGTNISAISKGLIPTDVYCGINCSDEHITRIRNISEKTGLGFHCCKSSETEYLITE